MAGAADKTMYDPDSSTYRSSMCDCTKAVCEGCAEFIETHLPGFGCSPPDWPHHISISLFLGYTVDLLLAERARDESLAEDMAEGMLYTAEGNEVRDITASMGASTFALVDESYIVLSAWQVTQRWRKTPKTMRLKGVKLPSYSKKGAMSVLYPFKNPDQPYKILRLQTVLSANASSDQKGCLPEALKNQIPIVLKGRKRKIDFMAKLEAAAEDQPEKHVPRRSPAPSKPALTPKGGGRGLGSGSRSTPKRPASADADALDFIIDPSIPKGTPDYWIAKLPLRQVAKGTKLGSEYNQAKVLRDKLPVGDDRNRLNTHIELYDKAMTFIPGAMEKLDEDKFIQYCGAFDAAGVQLLPVTQKEIARRKTTPLWEGFESSPRELSGRNQLKMALDMLRIWDTEDTRADFDWRNPLLVTIGFPVPDMNDAFKQMVFNDNLIKWIGGGECKEAHVLEFVATALEAWDIPVDANLDPLSGQILVDAQKALNVLKHISDQNISINTDLGIFDDVKAMEQAAYQTTAKPSLFISVAHAVNGNTFWKARLASATKKNEKMKANAPKIAKLLQDFRKHQSPTPTQEFHDLVKRAIDDIPYLRTALSEGAADELESVAMNKLLEAVRCWTSVGTAGAPKADHRADHDMMQSFKKLLVIAAESCPSFEDLTREVDNLSKVLDAVDSDSKMQSVKHFISKANADEAVDVKELVDLAAGVDRGSLDAADQSEMLAHFSANVKQLVERDFEDAPNRKPVDMNLEFEGVLVGLMTKDVSKRAEVVLASARAVLKLKRAASLLNEKVIDDNDELAGEGAEKQAAVVKREVAKATKQLKNGLSDEVMKPAGLSPTKFNDTAGVIVKGAVDLHTRVGQACLQKREATLAEARLHAQTLTLDNPDLCRWIDRGETEWEDMKRMADELLNGVSVEGIFEAVHIIEKAKLATSEYADDMAVKADSELMSSTPDLIKKVANIACEIQLMQAFLSKSAKDKVWLRGQCVAVQKELSNWKVLPSDMDSTVLAKYRSALKLQSI
ncbi:unnamed protein product [Prorocentrum cordatum]|uniref:Uncharacterized protein n=1 Tax=Prorocentrum cordatum TaxID=2364126 RepID=A0ABN9S963_9DINO|nr:unnamed protein product [Polarella glacialis]